jgi:ABC-type cobalamin/Fe3+-siderophores transport system ATPase subunit
VLGKLLDRVRKPKQVAGDKPAAAEGYESRAIAPASPRSARPTASARLARRWACSGPNGAGKTTVFYMITGLVPADQGRSPRRHDITSLPMYRRARLGIGYLPQEASIFRGLTVEQNIRAVLEVVEPDRKKREYELDALLEEFSITRLRKSPSIALSGGERRRCEIARALAGGRSSCCSTSPSPASTRSRSATSRIWCSI